MKIRFSILICTVLCLWIPKVHAQRVERVEPLCWWTGMNTDLQLMIYGNDLKDATVRVLEKGMQVKTVHNAHSTNYLFVDVIVDAPGQYTLEIAKGKKKTKVKYDIHTRRDGSGERVGFDSSDVIYLLMPDRFANGDESNDCIKGETQKLDRGSLDDRHGGDIQGIIDHLDYMADLGITTIWPTPVLEDNMHYHQYSCSDYYKVDAHFGDNTLYKEMVAKAHDKGLKVIQDIVPNHCGAGHWWMKDLPFTDWINRFDTFTQSNYALQSYSDPYASESDRELCERGWFVESLPDMNLSNPYTMKYLTQMSIWWIEYADLDGLRVDTYFYMGTEASTWTKGVLAEYPNLNMVAEVWGNDPGVIAYWTGGTKNKDGFNSYIPKVMDFPLERSLVMGFASDNEAWGGGMKSIYSLIAQDFLYQSPQSSLVVFADNHDIDRIYNMLGKSLTKTKMAMTLISTTRGIPQIYYGTELLFENDARGTAHQARPDFLGGWKDDKVDMFRKEDRTPQQQEMFTHVQTLLQYRKKTEVLHNGRLMHYLPKDNVYTYFRYNENDCVMVVINASTSEQKIDWARFEERLKGKNRGVDILTNKKITKENEISIPGESSMVIQF